MLTDFFEGHTPVIKLACVQKEQQHNGVNNRMESERSEKYTEIKLRQSFRTTEKQSLGDGKFLWS